MAVKAGAPTTVVTRFAALSAGCGSYSEAETVSGLTMVPSATAWHVRFSPAELPAGRLPTDQINLPPTFFSVPAEGWAETTARPSGTSLKRPTLDPAPGPLFVTSTEELISPPRTTVLLPPLARTPTSATAKAGAGATGSEVWIDRLQPPRDPASLEVSSTIKSDQFPFGLVPFNT